MLSRIGTNMLRKTNQRTLFFVNQTRVGENESPLPLFTTEVAPMLSRAKNEGNQLAEIQNNSNLREFMMERVPYLVLPQLKFKSVFHVIEMELYQESKMLKMTCLDVSKGPS